MARIVEHVRTPRSPQAAFDHLADFTTTAQWDPGIARAERLDQGPLAVGSRFRVHVQLGPVTAPFLYEIVTYDRPDHLVLVTQSVAHHGRDDVRIRATDDGGAEVVWDAEFALRGPGRLLDPLLAVGFRRTGQAAVAGLARALEGQVASV